MKKLSLYIATALILAACSGQKQAQSQTPKEVNQASTFQDWQPKLVKTQGSGPYDNVHCGIQTKDGLLWFGTSGEGIYRFDGKAFTQLTVKHGLPSNKVTHIIEDAEGSLWVATQAGVVKYSGKSFTPVPISKPKGSYSPIASAAKASPADESVPVTLYQGKNGKIWMGTSKGLYYYDGKSFVNFLENSGVENPNHLRLEWVQSILEDRQGNLWFTTWFDGLCKYDGKTLTHYTPNKEVWYSALLEDKAGNIWIGRRTKGVIKYDGQTFTNVLQHGVFDSCGVSTMALDKEGNIWIGAEADKLTKRDTYGGAWKYDGRTFTNLTVADGLPNYNVFMILQAKDGKLWLGTRDMGLCSYDGKRVVRYSE